MKSLIPCLGVFFSSIQNLQQYPDMRPVAAATLALFAILAPLTDGYEAFCGSDGVTYPSAEHARESGAKVMHCGPCGECSTLQDVGVYYDTRNTITSTATKCAWAYLLGGRRVLDWCLRKLIPFTEGCHRCWYENVICTCTECLGTCMKYRLPRLLSFSADAGEEVLSLETDPCLACDEQKCGPAFGTCAGANRRRAGITSDIARDRGEICSEVDYNWSELERLAQTEPPLVAEL